MKTAPKTSSLVALMAAAHFSHHVLTALLVPLIPFIRNEFALSYAQSGLVTSAFTLAYGVAQLPAGWLADRAGPRFVLLAGITGVAVAGAFIGVTPTFAVLLAGLVLLGITGGGYHPSASAIISKVVPPHRRGRALGLHIVGGSTSHFLAPLVAAGLVSVVGWRGTFLSLSAPVAALGVILFLVINRRIHAGATADAVPSDSSRLGEAEASEVTEESGGKPGPAPGDDARASSRSHDGAGEPRWSGARRRFALSRLVVFLILTGVIGSFIASIIPFISLYLVDARGVEERVAAALLSVIYAAGFFAAPLGGHISDLFGRRRVMIALGIATGPAIAALLIAPYPVAFAALMLGIGVLMFTKMPTAEAHIASEVPLRMRSTVLGIYFFSGMEGSALLTPFLGSIIDQHGFHTAFIGTAVVMAFVAVTCAVGLYLLKRGEAAQFE